MVTFLNKNYLDAEYRNFFDTASKFGQPMYISVHMMTGLKNPFDITIICTNYIFVYR